MDEDQHAVFVYAVDPDDAYTAGLALQTAARMRRDDGAPRTDDTDIVAAGRAVARELADIYDRVAAALMNPTVELHDS